MKTSVGEFNDRHAVRYIDGHKWIRQDNGTWTLEGTQFYLEKQPNTSWYLKDGMGDTWGTFYYFPRAVNWATQLLRDGGHI